MTFGYARCSTTESKQSVDRQIRKLKTLGATHIFCEYASGTLISRPELNKLFDVIKPGDIIICTEIARLTRSVKQLCDIISFAKENQLRLELGDLVVDCHQDCNQRINPLTEAMVLMAGVFASMERDIIVERVKSGIENARAKGVKLGRPRKNPKDLPPAVYRYWDRYKSGELSKVEYARLCQVSRSTIYRYIALLTD